MKTSGGKGLHLVIPLNGPADFEKSNAFAKKIARDFERKYPERVTANIRRVNRVGKVLIDWSQNSPHKSTVAPYSLQGEVMAERVDAGDVGRTRAGAPIQRS